MDKDRDQANAVRAQKHKGVVIWLTGLSGSGKTTTGELLRQKFYERGMGVEFLDGDRAKKNN